VNRTAQIQLAATLGSYRTLGTAGWEDVMDGKQTRPISAVSETTWLRFDVSCVRDLH
jgi:hypothetical protein